MSSISRNSKLSRSSKRSIAKIPKFQGRTLAYGRYRVSATTTELLLQGGLSGLGGEIEKMDGLLIKLGSLRGVPGPKPKEYAPAIEVKAISTGGVEINMDIRSGVLSRKIIRKSRNYHRSLRFHFYAILTVSIWASFETYLTMLFEELYTIRPQLLKSSEAITFRDVLEHEENLRSFLIQQQLEKLGHFTLTELLKYLNDRINFSIDTKNKATLDSYYLIRNIIAHRTGIVRPDQVDILPENISVRNNELYLTKQFLKQMTYSINTIVTKIEKHVVQKFYRSHPSA